MTNKRTKLWASISAVTLASVTGLSACTSQGEMGEGEGESAEPSEYSTPLSAAGEGEGESEGEGASKVELATDDLAYLTQLALVHGHLFVGYELYKAGHIDHAKTHMKHPESELYTDIEPAFKARGASGFASELSALSNAVENESGNEAVGKAYRALTAAIAKHQALVGDNAKTSAEKLKLVAALLRVAGEEYAIAVVDGKMENAHEYQDAMGFTTIAKSIVMQTEGLGEQKAKALKIFEELQPLWPSLIPPATLSTEAGQLYGAASKVELLALSIDE